MLGKEVTMYYGDYFDWLCELINLRPGMYDILIHELYSIDFKWVIDLDQNRADDGIIVRYDFHSKSSQSKDLERKPCSVLEMIIALAMKMNYLLDDEDRGDRTRIWFWEMIFNLGFKDYTDASFKAPYGRDLNRLNDIHEKCDRWMNREFGYDGFGSLFPLNKPHRDQRKIHLIDQMNDYILEKYIVNDEVM